MGLSWNAPEDGGALITDSAYRIERKGDWTSISSANITHTVAGVVNGINQGFQLWAMDRVFRSGHFLPAEVSPMASAVPDVAH